MTAWQRLGIEPTDNHREIKRAYAKQLKLIDQDNQPEEFIRLREALEIAQFEADHLTNNYDDQDSESIFESIETESEKNTQSENSNQPSFELSLKKIQHHIITQDIHFDIRHELIHFKNELKAFNDIDIEKQFTNQAIDILKENDLSDFLYIFSESNNHFLDSSNYAEDEKPIYAADVIETSQNNVNPLITALDEVVEQLWNKDISDTTFEKFSYLLNQQFDIPLSQQIQIKDQLQAPLAEIETSYLQSEYFRFLELWQATYPEDIHQYNQSYYSALLHEKLNNYLSRRQFLTKLTDEKLELLKDLSGEQQLNFFKMLKLKKDLSKFSPNHSAFEIIDSLQIFNTQNNINFIFIKSLCEIKKFNIINVLFALVTFVLFNFFINPNSHFLINSLITSILSFIFIFVLQPTINAKILSHSNYEKILAQYLKYWCLSGFLLCSFTPVIPELTHQLLSYSWFLCSIGLLGVLLLDATPFMNKIEQSAFIHFDTWMINIGLISLSLFFISFFFIIGEPNHIWLMVYSLIPISFLFFPESFHPLFHIFGYKKEDSSITEKQVIYKSISIIFFRLLWILGFSYFLLNSSSQPFIYAACLILASIIITGFSAKHLSSTLKYLTYTSLFIGTLYSIIIPVALIYFLYQSFQAKKLIASSL